MSGCVAHQGAMAMGCRDCDATLRGKSISGEMASRLFDRSYQEGFRAGVKAAREAMSKMLRDIETAQRLSAPRTDSAPTPEKKT